MASVPRLTCSCKVARCEHCLACRRCGCEHDGLKIADKLNRKRGQHGDVNSRVRKKLTRNANSYKPGDLFESPATPRVLQQQARTGKYTLFSAFSSSNPAVLSAEKKKVASVMRVFGLEDKVEYLYKHMPPQNKRSDPTTWQDIDDPSSRIVINTVAEIARSICNLFCCASEDAGAALWNLVKRADIAQSNEENISNNKFLHFVAGCYTSAQKASVEKRVLRACVCNFTFRDLKALRNFVPGFSISSDSFVQGRKDMQSLLDGQRIDMTKRSIQRFDPKAVEYAVSFILSRDNVSFLSWGTKRVPLDGRKVVFPAITRRRSMTAIFDAYMMNMIARPNDKFLSRASFFRIGATITAGGARLRSAVDYVVGFLVNDTFEILKHILASIELDSTERHMTQEIDLIRAYMKYGFDARLKGTSKYPCLLHSIEFGLDSTCRSDGTTSLCAHCSRVFSFYEHLMALLRSHKALPSTLNVVKDCALKAKLYLGHRIRVINQQIAIGRIKESMRKRCVEQNNTDEAIVTIDFKMKLEPMYFREKAVEHYGKRGISWHGAMVQYYIFDECIGSRAEPVPIEQKMYFDHISKGDNKQDKESVLSLIEAILMRLKQDLPHIKTIVLQSDNATCYQNTLIPLVLPFLSVVHGIEITRYIHTETQDGKSALDAHFARSMQVLVSWLKEGNSCRTPTQAVIGLKNNGGLPNCVVELIEHKRKILESLLKQVSIMEIQLRRFVKRANEIQISIVNSRSTRAILDTEYRGCPDFTLTFYEYSGIGPGISIHCSPASKLCTPVHTIFGDNRGRCGGGLNSSEIHEISYGTQNISVNPFSDGGNESNEEQDDDDESVQVENDEEQISENEQNEDIEAEAAIVIAELEEDDVSTGEDVESAAEEYEVEVDTEVIDPSKLTGPVTGVEVATQGQLRRRIRYWRKRPVNQVPQDNVPELRNSIDYAVRYAIQMHSSGIINVQDASDDLTLVWENDPQTEVPEEPTFHAGWAIRPKKGKMYGPRYIGSFREEIKELFMRGVQNKSSKIGPGRMLEVLRDRYPHRYDLPTESEIRQEISKLNKPPKSTTDDDSTATRRSAKNSTTDLAVHKKFFEDLLAKDPMTKPKAALACFRAEFGNSNFTDQQIKNKLSNIKSHRKKRP